MKTYTIIGNCQADIINTFLRTNPLFSGNYNYIHIKPIFMMNDNDADYVYNIVKRVDLVIIQPITQSYNKLSTLSILHHVKDSCEVILIPSLYLDFYYPKLKYIKHKDTNKILTKPCDYHDSELFNIISKGASLEETINKFINIVNDNNYIPQDKFKETFDKSISELIRRENEYNTFIPNNINNIHIITSSYYIKNNYKDKLLFWSMNHPTKYLFRYITDCILDILNIIKLPYPEYIDPLKNNNTGIIYASLQGCVNFDVTNIKPIVLGNEYDIISYIKLFYNTYSSCNLSDYILC